MAEFLRAFVPTFAFMLVPLLIPVLAVSVGAVSDRVRNRRRSESVADRARASIAQREAGPHDLAQAA